MLHGSYAATWDEAPPPLVCKSGRTSAGRYRSGANGLDRVIGDNQGRHGEPDLQAGRRKPLSGVPPVALGPLARCYRVGSDLLKAGDDRGKTELESAVEIPADE